MALPMIHHRFTADEYEQMIAVGILTDEDAVELICGEIVAMSPIGPRHFDCVFILNRLLGALLPDDLGVAVQSPVRLPNDSEPQPDLAVIRFARYRHALPNVGDIRLVIEVSDSTLDSDRAVKLPLYAAAGVPEAWLIDVAAHRVERHSQPVENRYRLVVGYGHGMTVESTTVARVAIPVEAIFGELFEHRNPE